MTGGAAREPVRLVLSAEADAAAGALQSLDTFIRQPKPCIIASQEDGTSTRWELDEKCVATLRDGVVNVYAGDVDAATADAIGACLWNAFAGLPMLAPADNRVVELTAPEHPWLLVDVPWEFARDASGARLGNRPLVRFVPGDMPKPATEKRPSVLVAIVNVPAHEYATAPIRPQLFVPAIPTELNATPPYFVAQQLGVHAEPVTYDKFIAALKAVAPSVVVLVAHGSSKSRERGPVVLFANADDESFVFPVETKTLAKDVAETTKSVVLTILLSCDQVRTGHVGVSGGLAFVCAGVPEIIAMQGEVPQDEAARFVRRALAGLFFEHSLSRAVSTGRSAITRGQHALTPVALRNRDESSSCASWRAVSDAYRDALRALTPPSLEALRRPACDASLEEILGRNGARVLRAPDDPRGYGAVAPIAALVKAHLDAADVTFPPRIVAVIDLNADARAEPDPDSWKRIAPRLDALLQLIRSLLPGDATPVLNMPDPPAAAADRLLQTIDDYGVCVVVNGVDIADENASAFWDRINAQAELTLRRGALVVVPQFVAAAKVEAVLHSLGRSEIKALDEAEIGDVMAREVGLLGMPARELLERTGGNPYLLHILQGMFAEGTPPADAVDALLREPSRTLAERAVAAILASSSREDLPKIIALSYLRRRADVEQTIHVLLLDDRALFHRLVRGGFVSGSARDSAAGESYDACWVASEVASVAATRIREQMSDASNVAAHQLLKRIADKADIMRIFSGRGGEVLWAAQLLLRDESLADDLAGGDFATVAYDLGLAANKAELAGSAAQRLVLEMLQITDQVANEYGDRNPDVLLYIAQIAQTLDDDVAYASAMKALNDMAKDPKLVPPEVRADALILEANELKNRKQRAGVPKAMEKLEAARAIVADAMKTRGAADPDLIAAQHRGLYAAMKIALFLSGNPVDYDLYRELIDRPQSPIERALALCTWAEREMARPEPVAWDQVGNWISEAENALTGDGGEAGLRSYCEYQIGQFYRKRPKANLDGAKNHREIASQFYRSVVALSERSGDYSREALALVRLACLQAKSRGTQVELPAFKQRMARLIAALSAEGLPQDALSARALDRMHRTLAELTSDPVEEAGHNRAAAAICATPLLSSATDTRRLAEAAACYLDLMVGRDGSFMAVRRFLNEIGDAVTARTHIVVDRDEPLAVRDHLRAYLAAASKVS